VNDREDRIREWNEYSAEEAAKEKKSAELKEELDSLWGQDLEKWNERREKKYREKALNRYSASKSALKKLHQIKNRLKEVEEERERLKNYKDTFPETGDDDDENMWEMGVDL